ncbi:MAG: hypothetical protein ABIJ47_05285 [Candidatus Bathyarchaeota archaeon]
MRQLLGFTLFLVILSAASAYLKQRELGEAPPRAVILDSLNMTRGHDFTGRCTRLLQGHGYRVDSFQGPQVTVDRFRGLKGYRIVVLRVHSGVFEGGAWLFTGEEYDGSKYVVEQLSDQVHLSRTPNDPRLMFAVGSSFVEHYMGDGLTEGLVILMGCDALGVDDLAYAFCSAGASAVVGWDGPVNLSDTDEAVLSLLEELLGGASLGEAVASGGSKLVYYPGDGGGWRLEG